MHSGKSILAAMYIRRVKIDGHSYAAASLAVAVRIVASAVLAAAADAVLVAHNLLKLGAYLVTAREKGEGQRQCHSR